jgi:hypothetical protein
MDHSSEVVTCDGQGPAEFCQRLEHTESRSTGLAVMHEFYQTMALETDRCLQHAKTS